MWIQPLAFQTRPICIIQLTHFQKRVRCYEFKITADWWMDLKERFVYCPHIVLQIRWEWADRPIIFSNKTHRDRWMRGARTEDHRHGMVWYGTSVLAPDGWSVESGSRCMPDCLTSLPAAWIGTNLIRSSHGQNVSNFRCFRSSHGLSFFFCKELL